MSPHQTFTRIPLQVNSELRIRNNGEVSVSNPTIETAPGYALDPNALAQSLAADKQRRYAGVLLTHNETSTGVQSEMAELAGIMQQHGALSIVDSVSGLGATDFRMDDWGYDIVVSASQKVLAAPPGLSTPYRVAFA